MFLEKKVREEGGCVEWGEKRKSTGERKGGGLHLMQGEGVVFNG